MATPLLHPALDPGLADDLRRRPVHASHVAHEGMVWDVRRDSVELAPGHVVDRELVDHPGAVAIVALDDDDRVLLIQQYRHPVGASDWEVPAGLLDIAAEPPVLAARRELAEEADIAAARWDTLLDFWTTPGAVSEAIRIFLARDLSAVPEGERHERRDEEAGMPTGWLALDVAVDAVLAGRIHNPSACVGLLAAREARSRGWATLRPADAPFAIHPRLRDQP